MAARKEAKKIEANAYVDSFKRIHFLLIVVATLVALSTYSGYSYEEIKEKVVLYDLIFAIQKALPKTINEKSNLQIVRSGELPYQSEAEIFIKATLYQARDLPEISKEVNRLAKLDSIIPKIDFVTKENRQIPNSFKLNNVRFLSNPGQVCTLYAYGGAGKKELDVFSPNSENQIRNITEKDLYFIHFPPNCSNSILNSEGRTLLAIKTEVCNKKDKCKIDWLIGLPKDYYNKIVAPSVSYEDPLSILDTTKLNLFSKYKAEEVAFITHDDKYYYNGIEFYKEVFYNFASVIKNKLYKPGQFNDAMKDMLSFTKSDIDFLGVKFEENVFIKIAPFVILILIYELYRRLKVICKNYTEITVPWIFKDVDNKLDFLIAALVSTTPTWCYILIYICYAQHLHMALYIWGHIIDIEGLVGWKFQKFVPGFQQYNYIASFVFLIYFLGLYFVYRVQKISYNLLLVMNSNWSKNLF